jgi:penicillin-binding protein 1A
MLKKAFKYVFHLLAVGTFTAGVVLSLFIYKSVQDLPDHSALKNYVPPMLSRVFSSDGRLIGELAQEKRVFIPYTDFPEKLIKGLLAVEDQHFFKHYGIDILSIVRSAFYNILSPEKRPGGASTITQQVARNFFLTNEISVIRKIKEAILAMRIEKALTKERILELYLNQIFLGRRAYGFASAAMRYFNKSLEDLTIPEIAFLCILPKAPSLYREPDHPKTIARRNWALERFTKVGLISKEEAQEFSKTSIVLMERQKEEVIQADYFQEEVRRELMDAFGEKHFYDAGLFIKTSLDSRLQTLLNDIFPKSLIEIDKKHGWRGPFKKTRFPPRILDEYRSIIKKIEVPEYLPEQWELAIVHKLTEKETHILTLKESGIIPVESMKWATKPLKNGVTGPALQKPDEALSDGDIIFVSKKKESQYELCQLPKVSGGVVVMDPHTGRVLAMTGGFSFKQTQFNRATQALRQPGSSIKPFVYLAALQAGKKPTDVYVDAPVSIPMGEGLGLWTPKNFLEEYLGPITLRKALEESKNTVIVQLARDIGMKRVSKTIQNLGIIQDPPIQLALVLGAGESTVYKMTRAYAAFANGGFLVKPTVIDWVQDRNGHMIYKHDLTNNIEISDIKKPPIISLKRKRVFDAAYAYMITSILQGAIEHSRAKTAVVKGHIVAGKSGTSNESRDVWFIGFSPNLVIGIYVGYDQPQNLGKMATGGWIVAPIFQKLMTAALEGTPPTPFKIPPNIKQKRINKKTGEPTNSDDPQAMWENFIVEE